MKAITVISVSFLSNLSGMTDKTVMNGKGLHRIHDIQLLTKILSHGHEKRIQKFCLSIIPNKLVIIRITVFSFSLVPDTEISRSGYKDHRFCLDLRYWRQVCWENEESQMSLIRYES